MALKAQGKEKLKSHNKGQFKEIGQGQKAFGESKKITETNKLEKEESSPQTSPSLPR
jgi:hypothetical protein